MAIFSVLLPTRNRVGFLRESLSSIQQQTLTDVEILVMDDGSQDGTAVFLDNAARCDDRIRIFRNERSAGLPAALNNLLFEANGEWIARMDDDDLALPQRLERQLEYATTHKLDVCGTWYRRFGWLPGGVGCPSTQHDAIVAGLLFRPPILHPSVLMKRSLLIDANGYRSEYPHAEDYELWTRLAAIGARFGNVPEVLLKYRVSRHQISRRANSKQVHSARFIQERYLASMDIPATPEQVALHVRVRDPVPIDSLTELQEFEAWLLYLHEHFHRSTLAADEIAQQWLFVGCRAAGLGAACWKMWKKSSLAAVIGSNKRALLFGLCASRMRYRSAPYRLLEPFAGA